MMKLNKRGTVSFEFVMIAVPFFVLMLTIFDLGRYAITQQSLRLLADAGAPGHDDQLLLRTGSCQSVAC